MPVTPLAQQCQIQCVSGRVPRATLASPIVPRQSKTTHITIKNKNTDTHSVVASWKRHPRCSGPVKPSHLSPPDKHPPDTVTFSPTQAKCEGCKRVCSLRVCLCVHVSLRVLFMHAEITGLLYKDQN